MAELRNHYQCARCGKQWTDEWSASCDDDCPHCGARHMSPHKSEDIGELRKKIRDLNDAFRSTFRGGKVMMTATVYDLPHCVRADALVKVVTFSDFTEGNDPHAEHDFGSFELIGRKFLWKIDYYDERCEFGSEDPSDEKKTTRVLTLMLAEDY